MNREHALKTAAAWQATVRREGDMGGVGRAVANQLAPVVIEQAADLREALDIIEFLSGALDNLDGGHMVPADRIAALKTRLA